MSVVVKSQLTGDIYNPEETCHIINPKQQCLYLKNGLKLVDLFISRDRHTGKDLVIMVFNKEE